MTKTNLEQQECVSFRWEIGFWLCFVWPINNQRSKSSKTGRDLILVNIWRQTTDEYFSGESFCVGIEPRTTLTFRWWPRWRKETRWTVVGVKNSMFFIVIIATEWHHSLAWKRQVCTYTFFETFQTFRFTHIVYDIRRRQVSVSSIGVCMVNL